MIYNKDMSDITKLIKHTMIDQNINNQYIADNLNKSRQAMSNLLRQENMTLNMLYDICDAMDCDLIIDIVPREKK